MQPRRPVIAIDIDEDLRLGGPFINTMSIVNSDLKLKYDFKLIYHKPWLQRGIGIRRIVSLYKQIKAANPDAIHINGLQISGFATALASKFATRSPILVTVRGSTLEARDTPILKKVIVVYIFEMITLLLASAIYSNSRYSGNIWHVRLFKKKFIGHIYNLPPVVSSLESTFSVRNKYGIGSDELVFVSVGRVTRDKGFEVLVRAVKSLDETGVPFRFVIVGGGEYLHKMQEECRTLTVQGKMLFLGIRSDVLDIVRECDIFVLPTLHETLSTVLLEASQLGKPLIATSVGGIPEIIQEEYNGLLVRPGSAEALAQAMMRLVEDGELRKSLGSSAFKVISEKFERSGILASIDKVYSMLLKR